MKNDFIASIVLLLISSISVVYSLSLPQGITAMGVPKSGVFPLIISIALVSSSLILFIKSYKSIKNTEGKIKINLIIFKHIFGRKNFLIIFGIFVYFLIILLLGYLVATLLMYFIVLYFVYKGRLFFALLISVFLSIGTYLIFEEILNVNLPKGIFF